MNINSRNLFLMLLASATSAAACSNGNGGAAPAATWECRDVVVPLGHTRECVSSASAAMESSNGVDYGPAYHCASKDDASAHGAECPPDTPTGGTGDGDGSGSDNGDIPAGGDRPSCDAGASIDGGGPKAGPKAGAGGDDKHRTGVPAPECSGGSGASGGGAYDAGSSEPGDRPGGYYCTRERDKRVCREAPKCEPGSHRVQMDCDSDVSVGVDGTPAGTGYSGGGTCDTPPSGGTTECFYPVGATPGTAMPAATAWYVLEAMSGVQLLHVRLTFTPTFVDNTYGSTAIGWPKGHKFSELVGSDHAELSFLDKAATEKLHFKMDYISKSSAAPSGYACLGVTGGEGRMILGDASAITKAITSLDRNLNERGYASYLVDSPPTNAQYTPSASTPNWDYRVVYEMWVKNDALGAAGFGNVQLKFVHASPSKIGTNTVTVVPGPCPPGW